MGGVLRQLGAADQSEEKLANQGEGVAAESTVNAAWSVAP